jgi:hypothetical protein
VVQPDLIMTPEEAKAVLLAEMRLAGIAIPIVNYWLVYIGKPGMHGQTLEKARRWFESDDRRHANMWLEAYGKFFEDSTNLPTNENWRLGGRTNN